MSHTPRTRGAAGRGARGGSLPRGGLWALLLCAAVGGPGCASAPPSHLTRLWPEGRTGKPLVGLSTEDGVLVLAAPDYEVGQLFEIHFPVGNSLVRDWGRIDRLNDTLAVIRPQTARLLEGRIATQLPRPGEQIYLALRDEQDEQVMLKVARWRDGAAGDWVVLAEHDATEVARDSRGSGLYVDRDGRWQIVGVLAGLTAWDEAQPADAALGYVGLQEMARILPDRILYFEHDVRPLRPDFEFGVPLQPGDINLDLPAEAGDGDDAESDDAAPEPAEPPPAPRG